MASRLNPELSLLKFGLRMTRGKRVQVEIDQKQVAFIVLIPVIKKPGKFMKKHLVLISLMKPKLPMRKI